MKEKRGQIWVETVIYTLIAFALMALVLTFAKPKIEEIQDKEIISQSINVLKDIDIIIRTIGSTGNQRVIDLGISEGTLNIDGVNDQIFFEIESRYTYSEPGLDIRNGAIIIHNEQIGKINNLNLSTEYTSHDIKFQNTDELKKINKAPTPYKLLVSNTGQNPEGKTIINVDIIS